MSFPLLVGRYQFVTEIVYLYYNKTHERTASETHSLWFSRLWANAQRTIKDLLYSYLREGFRDVDVFRLAACRREKLGRGFARISLKHSVKIRVIPRKSASKKAFRASLRQPARAAFIH